MGDFSIAGILMMLVALGFSVMFHEIMHGWVALKLGDPTAKNDGRLTFNPVSHIDPMMTIVIPMLMYMTSGFIFGGAKPVRINHMNFKNPGLGMALSAAAGPLSNFFLAIVSFGLLTVIYHVAPDFLYDSTSNALTYNSKFIQIMIFLNILLGAFNLIPIPPLDGSRVLRYFLPYEGQKFIDRIEPFGLFILLAVLFLPRYFGLPSILCTFLSTFFWLYDKALMYTFDLNFYITFLNRG